jgi:hypothetical protein
LLATGFIFDARSQKGKGRLAFELLVVGAVIVAVLVAIAASKTERSGTLGAHFPKQGQTKELRSVMSLDTCFDALRFLARSPETALNSAIKREKEIGLQGAASFWLAISEYIASRRATLGDD